jgi:hypothetical protein
MTKKKQSEFCELFSTYIFLLWDGLGFFGFDDNKLDRLKGISVKWYDRFTNKRWIMFNVTSIIIFIAVLSRQLGGVGGIKQQQINYEKEDKYELPLAEHLTLTG